MKITISKDSNPNYLATVCRIENIISIPNADRLVKTTVNGYDMIIPKTMNIGDIVVYFPCESCVGEKILSVNNLYARDEFERNANADEIKNLIIKAENASDDDRLAITDEIRSKCGFFNKYGRVRILKLRGEYSQGFIIEASGITKAYPEITDWDSLIGKQFDMIGDDVICKKYVPVTKAHPEHCSQSHWKHRMKKLKRFDRLIPDTFIFHYDTTMLAEHIKAINPDDVITITTKVHGTSIIISNIPVLRKLSFFEKVKKFIGIKVPLTEYDIIYSSRSVIKNQYVNAGVNDGFYGADIWGCVTKVFGKYIPHDWTVYGEVVGYVEGTGTFIQKNHDYGCKPGEWKFMPYRISERMPDGSLHEWNVSDVCEWTENLKSEIPVDDANRLMPIDVLYHGVFSQLYPNVPVNDNFHINMLEMLKTDAHIDDNGHIGMSMEKNEPMCINKVPREGIVVRIDNDMMARAWKLKTKAHYAKECEQHDAGEADVEETA